MFSWERYGSQMVTHQTSKLLWQVLANRDSSADWLRIQLLTYIYIYIYIMEAVFTTLSSLLLWHWQMPQNHTHKIIENASRLYVYIYTSFCPQIKDRFIDMPLWVSAAQPYSHVSPQVADLLEDMYVCMCMCTWYVCMYIWTYVYSCKYFPLWWSMQPIIHCTCYLTSVFSNTNNRTMYCDLQFYFIYKTLVFPTPQTICQTCFNWHN